jgi:cytochrome c oxidase subunit 3
MLALPAAPAPAPRRQLLVGTSLACAAVATFYAGMLALYLRFRQSVKASPDGVWRPKSVTIPEVPTNVMLIGFLGVVIFAQWAVYAARRGHRSYTVLAVALTALLGVAIINAQAFVYSEMHVARTDGTYQMFFYTLTGTFVFLAIVGLFFSVVTAFRFLGGRTEDREIVTAHAIYWYFLAAVFTALWFVVYVTK